MSNFFDKRPTAQKKERLSMSLSVETNNKCDEGEGEEESFIEKAPRPLREPDMCINSYYLTKQRLLYGQ